MDCTYYTTETRKGQHLSFEERVTIKLRLKDGWNINQIAKDLNRSYNGIKKRSHVAQCCCITERSSGTRRVPVRQRMS